MSKDCIPWPGKPFQSCGKSNVHSKYSSCSEPSKFTINHVLWLLKKNQNKTPWKKTPLCSFEPWDDKAVPQVTGEDEVSYSQIKRGKCIQAHACLDCQSATETNHAVSSRTTKAPSPWIHISRLISSEILWEDLHSHCSLSVATRTRPLSHTQLLIFTKSVKTSCFWHLYLSVRFDRIWPTGSQLLCGSRINTVCFYEPDFCREPVLSAGIFLAHQQSKGSGRCCCLISQAGNVEISPWSLSRAWSPSTPGLEDEQQQTVCSALHCRKDSHWGSVSVSFLTSWDRQPVPKRKSSVFPIAGEIQPWNLLLLLQLSCNIMYSAPLPNSHDSQLRVSNGFGKGNT